MEKIEIEFFDLEFERNIQRTEGYFELHDTYFRYVAKYDSEIPKDRDDKYSLWEEKFHDFDIRVKRECFVSLEKYWNDKNDYWQLEMEVSGYPNVIKLYFQKDDEQMTVVFEILFKWIFNQPRNNFDNK